MQTEDRIKDGALQSRARWAPEWQFRYCTHERASFPTRACLKGAVGRDLNDRPKCAAHIKEPKP